MRLTPALLGGKSRTLLLMSPQANIKYSLKLCRGKGCKSHFVRFDKASRYSKSPRLLEIAECDSSTGEKKLAIESSKLQTSKELKGGPVSSLCLSRVAQSTLRAYLKSANELVIFCAKKHLVARTTKEMDDTLAAFGNHLFQRNRQRGCRQLFLNCVMGV